MTLEAIVDTVSSGIVALLSLVVNPLVDIFGKGGAFLILGVFSFFVAWRIRNMPKLTTPKLVGTVGVLVFLLLVSVIK